MLCSTVRLICRRPFGDCRVRIAWAETFALAPNWVYDLPMFKLRAELNAMLDQLEKELPGMIKMHPDAAEFWSEFCGKADVIEDSAPRGDFGVVRARIEGMLATHNLVRGRSSGESSGGKPQTPVYSLKR
jgi:hypothetical protein